MNRVRTQAQRLLCAQRPAIDLLQANPLFSPPKEDVILLPTVDADDRPNLVIPAFCSRRAQAFQPPVSCE